MTTLMAVVSPFDLCKIAEAAGVTYVARAHDISAAHEGFNEPALLHEGFAVLEILSQCPTHFGRYALNTGVPVKVLDLMRYFYVMTDKTKNMDAEELEDKVILGEFVNKTRPIFKGSSVYRGEEQ